MNQKIEGKFPFWEYDESGKIKINTLGLIEFLDKYGFANARINNDDQILVRMINNRMSKSSEAEIDRSIQNYLLEINERKVLESYA